MSVKGWIVLSGQSLPITDIFLRHGKIWVSTKIDGPAGPFSGVATIFGEDNKGCWQGLDKVEEFSVPKFATYTINVSLTVTRIERREDGQA